MTDREAIRRYADEIESWLRANGVIYLTTARHAIRWPADASAAEITAAINHLIATSRVVVVEGGITGLGLRVPNVWPEWVNRITRGSSQDLSTRIALSRCRAADAQTVAS